MTRRKVKPPIDFVRPDRPFQTREELDAYLGGDTIACLLCGLNFAKLPSHLLRRHAIPVDDYKAQFGIPYTRGLSSRKAREAASALLATKIADGRFVTLKPGVFPEHLRDRPRRTPPSFVVKEDEQKLVDFRGAPAPWTRAHYEEYLRRMATGRTLTSVGKDPDMPTHSVFTGYVARDADLKKRYEEVLANLPLHVRAKSRHRKPDWKDEVILLKANGLTWTEIAAKTGLKMATLKDLEASQMMTRSSAVDEGASPSESA